MKRVRMYVKVLTNHNIQDNENDEEFNISSALADGMLQYCSSSIRNLGIFMAIIILMIIILKMLCKFI